MVAREIIFLSVSKATVTSEGGTKTFNTLREKQKYNI